MAGLLEDPKQAAMMQLGLGLLSRSGPSRTPVAIGQAMGEAGQESMQTYQQADQNMQMKQMRDFQMQQQRAQAEEAQKRQAALQQFRAQLPQPLQNQFDLDPMGFIQQLKPKAPMTVAPGASLVDPNNGYKPVFTAPKEAAQTDIEKLIAARDRLQITDPNRSYFDSAIRKATTHAPAASANVNFKQETEEAKAVGKAFGETYGDLMKSDMMASSKIAKYAQLSQLLDGVDTGRLTPIGTDISAFAKSMGINIDPNLGNKQAAEAISNDLALQLRNPSGGAGMPGALSDKDREFLTKMTPGIGKDQQANKVLIETAKKLAQREKDVAKIARQYRQKRGTLDEGFYEELAAFSERNPLFEANGGGWSATVIK